MSASDTRSSLEIAIDTGVEKWLKELHTCLPGEIISFDPVEQEADIQLAIKRKQDGKLVDLPVLSGVPVRYLSSLAFSITFPLNPGDEVLVFFSERSIDVWLENGGMADPSDIRRHNLSDAIAIPINYSQPNKISSFNPDDLEIRTSGGNAKIAITTGGAVNIETAGDVNVTGDVIADGISLKTHTHPINSGSSAPGPTGQPT